MRIHNLTFVLASFCITLWCSHVHHANALTLSDILTVDQLKAGMRGKGRSVFEGTKIEEFDVTIIGVLHRVDFDQDIILVRVDSGTVVKKNTGIIAGMSGSPIFVGGKLIGAIAYAWSFSKVPIAGVQPIAQMLQSLNPSFSPPRKTPMSFRPKDGVLKISGEQIKEVVVVENDEAVFAMRREGVGILKPVATPLMVSGLNKYAVELLRRSLSHYNLLVVEAPTGSAMNLRMPPKLEPGASIGIQLADGDVDISAVGTVTWVEGSLVLAFGHPALGLGEIEMPMTTAYVWDVISRQSISFKLATSVKPVGTFTQDRSFATCGFIGRHARMVKMNISVSAREKGFGRNYRLRLVKHRQVIAELALASLLGSMYVYTSPAEEGTMKMQLDVKLEGLPEVKRENIFDMQSYGGFGFFALPRTSPVGELMQVISALIENPYRDVTLESINVSLEYESKRRLAWIDQVTAEKASVKPGEILPVTLRLRERNNAFHTLKLSLKIPTTVKPGIIQIAICGGMLGRQARARVGARLPRAYSVEQLIELLNSDYQNDQLIVCMSTGTMGVELDGREVCTLPSPVLEALFSMGTSKVLPIRDFVETREKVNWLISGMALLTVSVETKEKEKEEPFRPPALREGSQPSEGSPEEGLQEGTPVAKRWNRDDELEWQTAKGHVDFIDLVEAIASKARMEALKLFPQNEELIIELAHPQPDSGDDSHGTTSSASTSNNTNEATNLSEGIEAPQPLQQGKKQLDKETPPPMPSWEEVEALELGRITRPAKEVPPTPPAKTQALARAPQVWVMDKFEDFIKGEFNGTCITGDGEVGVGLKRESLYNPEELCVWVCASDQSNNTYAGTWMPARLLKITPDGRRETIAEWGDEVGVISIVTTKAGDIYCGLVPSGKVYRVSGKDVSLVADLKGEYPWAMAFKDGSLFIATGPKGRIYRLDKPNEVSLLAQLPDRHAIAMVADPNCIYVGTNPKGKVFCIDASGNIKSIFETPTGVVQSLALDRNGNLFVGTAGQAKIYILKRDGSVKEISKFDGRHVFAMMPYEDGVLAVVCPKAKVYSVNSDGRVEQLYRGEEPFIVSLSNGVGRSLLATAMAKGLVMLQPESHRWVTYESPVKDAGMISRWGAIRWYADSPEDGSIVIETRSGNTAFPDETWSDWSEPYSTSGDKITSPPARFIQFRVRLYPNKEGQAPRLRRVEITYMPKNRPPELTIKQPQPGTIVSGTYKVQWDAKDPDKDRLSFEVYYSQDKEKWLRVEEVGAEAKVKQKEEGEKADGGGEGSPTTKSEINWDTKKLKDGVYYLRVVASDHISNPIDAERVERIVYPVIVDNTPPEVVSPTPNEKISMPLKSIRCYDSTTYIASAEYRIDEGEWIAGACSDGVFDSKYEDVVLDISKLKKGRHTLELRVRDAAGNERTVKWEYEWKE